MDAMDADPTRNPFPGMNPYLEARWGDVHTALISYIRDAVDDDLPRGLQAKMQERVFVESLGRGGHALSPDVLIRPSGRRIGAGTKAVAAAGVAAAAGPGPMVLEIPVVEQVEPYVTITDPRSGGQVITIIEVVSPSNKLPGEGRRLYRRKQREARRGGVNLVEVDLLRAGRPVTIAGPHVVPPAARAPYHVAVQRGGRRDLVEYYPIGFRNRLPVVNVPLRAGEPDLQLDLQPPLDRAYRKGRYFDEIDYARPPEPPLGGDDAGWAASLLRAAGLVA